MKNMEDKCTKTQFPNIKSQEFVFSKLEEIALSKETKLKDLISINSAVWIKELHSFVTIHQII